MRIEGSRIEGSRLEALLAQAVEQQNLAVNKDGSRYGGLGARAAQALSAAQAQSAVHLSTTGQAMAAVIGTAGLTATSRTQASSQVMDVGQRGAQSTVPVPQILTIRRIVEQVTGKQIGVFNGLDLGPMAPLGGSASTADPAATLAQAYRAKQMLKYAASGTVTAADGARIGFTVVLTMENRQVSGQRVDVSVNHVGSAASQPDIRPRGKPEVDYGGPGSDLEGHGIRFDLGLAGGKGSRPQMVGAGVVVFEQATKTFTVEDVKAALRGLQVI